MVRITTIFDLHRWYTQSDRKKWFTLILFFWHYLFHLFSLSLAFSSSHISHQSLKSSCSLITHQKSSSLIHILPSPLQSSSLIAYSILISGSLKLAVCRHGFNLTTSSPITRTSLPPPPWFVSSFVFIFFLSYIF